MMNSSKKALIVTTVSGFVPQFEMQNVELLQSMGFEVHYATNYHNPVYTDNNDRLVGTNIVKHQVDFVRSPFQVFQNIKAYKQLSKLMKRTKFDIVHCHTPMGSVLARLAALRTNTKPVLYTAHGFHFYKGAPIINWLLFYPVEKYLAKYTDSLITLNDEDYKNAKRFSLRHNNEVYKINGIGVPIDTYLNDQVTEKNEKHPFTLINVGELSKRKNQIILLKALAKLKDPTVKVIICGSGNKLEELKKIANKLGIQSQLDFKGYCTNIKEQLRRADCFVFPSLQEGLPVALMEAMSAGLPVICSDVRGNRDLIKNGEGGYLVAPKDVQGYAEAIKKLKMSNDLCIRMGKVNQLNVKNYSDFVVREQMKSIYQKVLHLNNE